VETRLQAKGFSRVWSNTRMRVSRSHSSLLWATLSTLAAMGSRNTSGYGSLCSALRQVGADSKGIRQACKESGSLTHQ